MLWQPRIEERELRIEKVSIEQIRTGESVLHSLSLCKNVTLFLHVIYE